MDIPKPLGILDHGISKQRGPRPIFGQNGPSFFAGKKKNSSELWRALIERNGGKNPFKIEETVFNDLPFWVGQQEAKQEGGGSYRKSLRGQRGLNVSWGNAFCNIRIKRLVVADRFQKRPL